jgi:hypothetical protein
MIEAADQVAEQLECDAGGDRARAARGGFPQRASHFPWPRTSPASSGKSLANSAGSGS